MAEQGNQHFSAGGKAAKGSQQEYLHTGKGQGGQASPSSHQTIGDHAGGTREAWKWWGKEWWEEAELSTWNWYDTTWKPIGKHGESEWYTGNWYDTSWKTIGKHGEYAWKQLRDWDWNSYKQTVIAQTSRLRRGLVSLRDGGDNFPRFVRPLAPSA